MNTLLWIILGIIISPLVIGLLNNVLMAVSKPLAQNTVVKPSIKQDDSHLGEYDDYKTRSSLY